MGGKLTLIQSGLYALPIHVIFVLNPREKIFQQIEKVFAQLFWGQSEGKHKKSWIA